MPPNLGFVEISLAYQEARMVVFDQVFSSWRVEKIKFHLGILGQNAFSPGKDKLSLTCEMMRRNRKSDQREQGNHQR